MSKQTYLLKEFNYEVNFQLATEALAKHDIDFSHEIVNEKFRLYINENQKHEAEKIIASLDLDDTIVNSEDGTSLEEYGEWAENQYSPSYYTGGKTPHWYSDKKTLKILGPLILMSGILGTYYFFDSIYDKHQESFDLMSVLYTILYLFAGVMATMRAYRK